MEHFYLKNYRKIMLGYPDNNLTFFSINVSERLYNFYRNQHARNDRAWVYQALDGIEDLHHYHIIARRNSRISRGA